MEPKGVGIVSRPAPSSIDAIPPINLGFLGARDHPGGQNLGELVGIKGNK